MNTESIFINATRIGTDYVEIADTKLSDNNFRLIVSANDGQLLLRVAEQGHVLVTHADKKTAAIILAATQNYISDLPLNAEPEDKDKEIESLKAKIESISSERLLEFQSHVNELEKLKAELTSVRADRDHVLESLEEHKDQIEKLKDCLSAAKQRSDFWFNDCAKQNCESIKLKNEIEKLKAELKESKKRQAEMEQDYNAAITSISTLRQNRDSIANSLEQYKERENEIVNRERDLKRLNDVYENQCSETNRLRAILKAIKSTIEISETV